MKSRRNLSLTGTLIALFCAIIILVTGCTPCVNGYKRITIDKNKGLTHFSFEYPCDWKFETFSYYRGFDFFTVKAPPFQRGEDSIFSTYWVIDYSRAGDATRKLDLEVSSSRDNLDFKVLERSQIKISGLQAEKAVLTFKFRPLIAGSFFADQYETLIVRVIALEHNGLWTIKEQSNSEVAGVNEIHFQHMLDTFEFLD